MLYTSLREQDSSASKTPSHLLIHNKQRGTSLIELIVSVSITAILSAIAVPSFNEFIVKMRVDSEISHLTRLLATARNYSINSGQNVILCPLEPGGNCSVNWHKELSVFIDVNGNQKFDSTDGELLVITKAEIKLTDTLKYAKNRTKITYQPTGHLFGLANGTFKYCPKEYKDLSRGVVIARSGRFYATSDVNSDGIDETRSKKIITCD